MKRILGLFVALLGISAGIGAGGAFAAQAVPECMDGDRVLPVDNAKVLEWKATTRNEFKARARVEGSIVRVFPDRNSHLHVEISIGGRSSDVLEVVYNYGFGATAEPRVGMWVEACGDYITAIAQSGPYPPSPSGAIIHWLHRNPRNNGHEHGYMVMDGIVYGVKRGRSR